MTADNRTVTTDALETLGSIITANEKRDAIHLAVENVVAHDRLRAGEPVFLDVDGLARFANPGGSVALGIVDPFLTVPVAAGDHFWLVVNPRQITSLRHVWEHPAFPNSGETGSDIGNDVADVNAATNKLQGWIDSSDLSGESFLDVCDMLMNSDDTYLTMPYDAGGTVPSEVYVWLKTITGREPLTKVESLSCSC